MWGLGWGHGLGWDHGCGQGEVMGEGGVMGVVRGEGGAMRSHRVGSGVRGHVEPGG